MLYSDKVQAELASAQETAIANKILDMMQRLKLNNDEISACRWVWELIQNAKDVVNSTGLIDIRIDFNEKKKFLSFQHNGKLFTTKNIVHLISQVSSKERDNSEERKTTGKFGTGFLTTHLLSEKVIIDGLLQDPGEEIKKIKVQLDRSGDTKEKIIASIKESFVQLENSEELDSFGNIDETEYHTIFSYQLDDEGMKIAKRGLNSLCISIPYIFAFLNEINSITINDIVCYRRGKIKQIDNMTVQTILVEQNAEVSEKFVFKKRKDDVEIAVPVTLFGESISVEPYAKGVPKLFCDFPLLGTEDFSFPVVINSSLFNPTEPRNGIFLTDKENAVITENKTLMFQALEDYKEILDYAAKNGWKQMYNIVSVPSQSSKEWISKEWLKENITDPCKEYIKEAEIIDTEFDGRKALYDWFDNPKILLVGDTDAKLRENVWSLTQYILPRNLTKFSEIHKWYSSLWLECRNFSFEKLIDIIESYENLEVLESNLCNGMKSIDWLNKLYETVINLPDEDIYKNAKIFPNQLGKFCAISELLYDGGIESVYKDILSLLEKECRVHLLDNRIDIQNNIQRPFYNYDALFEEIERGLDTDRGEYREALEKLIVLYDDTTKDDQEHTVLLNLLDAMFDEELPDDCKVKKVSEPIMKKAKNYWCTTLADEVSECKCICELEKVIVLPENYSINQWIAELIEYIVKYKHNNLLDKKTKPILPNQKGTFRTLEGLFLDSGELDEIFKDILLDADYDIREELLLVDIYLELPNNRTKYLKDISQDVVNYVKDNQGKIKNQEPLVIENLKKIFLWINDNESKAKEYFGELLENKHWLYNDHEIADNMRKAEAYDDLLKKYNIYGARGLEDILRQHEKENKEEAVDEEEITEEFLVQSGISCEEEYSKAIDMNIFGNNFVHVSESNADKFAFVEQIIERSKKNIIQYLNGLDEYDLSEMIPLNKTIFIIKKHGKEMFLIVRPSDYGQVILYYDLEKDVLDYEKDWELWIENGKSTPERITFGKMMKLTGINKIPLRKVR